MLEIHETCDPARRSKMAHGRPMVGSQSKQMHGLFEGILSRPSSQASRPRPVFGRWERAVYSLSKPAGYLLIRPLWVRWLIVKQWNVDD